jgi:hypothetical protein
MEYVRRPSSGSQSQAAEEPVCHSCRCFFNHLAVEKSASVIQSSCGDYKIILIDAAVMNQWMTERNTFFEAISRNTTHSPTSVRRCPFDFTATGDTTHSFSMEQN